MRETGQWTEQRVLHQPGQTSTWVTKMMRIKNLSPPREQIQAISINNEPRMHKNIWFLSVLYIKPPESYIPKVVVGRKI